MTSTTALDAVSTTALDAVSTTAPGTLATAATLAGDWSRPVFPLAAEAPSASPIGPVRAAVVALLVVIGLFFLFVGTVGLVRLPTVYNRLHATSKATTLGTGVIALAGFVFYGLDPAALGGDGLLALVTVVFLFLTAPTGAHMISRAAQRMGVPFVEGVDWPGPDLLTDDPEEGADGGEGGGPGTGVGEPGTDD
jgi:multicomponent Na+:H+ antiporter subunit G